MSRKWFPQSDSQFPEGSFYKADGDAVTYILQKASVALRASIEFMQDWYSVVADHFPDCRVFIDHGSLDFVDVPGKKEVVGKPFENISIFEKGLQQGRIYLTRQVIDSCDPTMAKFSYYCDFTPRLGERISLYYVNYLDPRTISDSSLIHALFVAHPKAGEARERVLELFVADCLIRNGGPLSAEGIKNAAQVNGYPLPPAMELEKSISAMTMVELIEEQGVPKYALRPEVIPIIEDAKKEFCGAQQECLKIVRDSIARTVGSEALSDDVNLTQLVENYLYAVFSEIRMMANYFRETSKIFDAGTDSLHRFSFVIKRHFPNLDIRYFPDVEDSFLRGLKSASEIKSLYIASIFHNVLATYYLNRSVAASPYQIEKLRQRRIFYDTNVLYSLLVPSSPYHEFVSELTHRLQNIGISVRVFPFTVAEYEHSLSSVEKQFRPDGPTPWLIAWNPWLFQEFRSNPAKYLNSMAVCRQEYSICGELAAEPDNYAAIDSNLKKYGAALETEFTLYDEKQVQELWIELRNAMTSDRWDLNEYWEFIHAQAQVPDEVIAHDVNCIQNLMYKAEKLPADELGPRVMFISLDSRKILKLRKKYQFILSTRQCQEFILPYLFLSNIPLIDPGTFPNQLLSAQLATMLVKKPPEMNDVVRAFIQRPDVFDEKARRSPTFARIERALSRERFEALGAMTRPLDPEHRERAAKEAAVVIEEIDRVKREQHFKTMNSAPDLAAALAGLKTEKSKNADLERKVSKLRSTIKYWQQQAKGRNR